MNVHFRAMVPSDLLTVRQFMNYPLSETTRGVVAYDMDTADTLAVFLMDNWTQTTAQVHQVILKNMVLRHGWLEEIARFAFTTAARKKVYATVPDNNAKALRLNAKLGFTQVARLTDAWAEGVDYLILELEREKCPFWLPERLQKVS